MYMLLVGLTPEVPGNFSRTSSNPRYKSMVVSIYWAMTSFTSSAIQKQTHQVQWNNVYSCTTTSLRLSFVFLIFDFYVSVIHLMPSKSILIPHSTFPIPTYFSQQ